MFTVKLCLRHFASLRMPKRLFRKSIVCNKRNKIPKLVNTKSVKEVKLIKMTSQASVSEASLEIKYLETPNKSQNDSKEYRVVRLKNGLTALLISDVANLITLDPQEEKEGSCEYSSESEEEFEEESEASASDDDHDEADTVSKKKYAMQQEKLAALGLCVGVGSFSDPWEIQGLAHFVEHMVFMGSEKYPKENDFDDFIKKRGGFDNAETECEYTTFYFECQEKHLEEAMDKFSQFFISPLMKREAMTREREAVESEFQHSVSSDSNRKEQLLCGLAEESNPIKKFTWGNLVTLRDNVKDDHLYAAAHEFRKRHYSAHRMTLAIQARLPIDILESWVKAYFSGIPNNNLPGDDFKKFAGSIFNTPDFKRMYWVKSVKDIYQVELTWALPSLLHMYRSKPHEYVASVIGDEGKGSLLAYLRRKVWALSIYSGNGESGCEHNTMCTLFTINIILTETGFKCLKQVLDAVFGYIHMLQKVGPSERYFKELQTISETSFRFVDESPAADYVESLCESMQLYPPQDYITGSDLYFEYDPKAIQQCYDALTHDTVNIIVSSKKCEWEYDRTEIWFNTKYTVRDIPNDWLEDWANIEPDSSFHLPDPNIFLTTDFTILPFPEDNPSYPVKIHNDEYSEVWYRRDTKFKLPEAYLYYYFITPLSFTTPHNAAMMDLFVGILKQQLIEEVYPAEVAELNYSIYPYDKGIMLKLSGFNEKLPLLLEAVVRHLKTFEAELNPDLFEAVKEGTSQGYHNYFIKPGKFEKDLRFTLLISSYWNAIDKHSVIPKITLPMLKTFARQLLDHLYIKSLVQGNISKEKAVEACSKMVKILQSGPLLPDTHPQIRVAQLPLGQHCMRSQSFNKDSNSVVTNYYQSGPIDVGNCCIVDFLVMLMEEPVFDVLRTKEQLGYHVFPLLRDTFGILGFSITVNFQVTKYSPDHIDGRIEAFMKSFAKKLMKIPKEELEEVRESLLKLKQLTDIRLKEEVDRNWSEIASDDYMFDRLEREVKHIQDIKKEQIKKWLDDHISCGSKKNFRKLSIQVVGHDKENRIDSITVNNTSNEISNEVLSDEDTSVEPDNRKNYALQLEKGAVADNSYFISDHESFKNGLFIYPVKCNTGT